MAKKRHTNAPIPDDVGWTIRLPKALAEAVRARARELTAQGRGRWSGARGGGARR